MDNMISANSNHVFCGPGIGSLELGMQAPWWGQSQVLMEDPESTLFSSDVNLLGHDISSNPISGQWPWSSDPCIGEQTDS